MAWLYLLYYKTTIKQDTNYTWKQKTQLSTKTIHRQPQLVFIQLWGTQDHQENTIRGQPH